MKAISIKQPWAYAILHLGKNIENRTWKTNYRGRVLIHASKNFDNIGFQAMIKICPYLDFKLLNSIKNSPRGCIVGAIDIVGCVSYSTTSWFFGPYGWVLENPQSISPIPYKGQLGFFDVEGVSV